MGGLVRRRLSVSGIVQGVGFRPYVWRQAVRLDLSGFVANHPGGVIVEVQGPVAAVTAFTEQLAAAAPPLARVSGVTSLELPVAESLEGFVIRPSVAEAAGDTSLPADVATCAACLAELHDPADRRYGHAFIACTDCGPRYTIITGPPYDRATTTMRSFPMCPACDREYHDPANRRFHAEPIGCHDCGPVLWYAEAGQADVPVEPAAASIRAAAAVARARRDLLAGKIVAIKGVGGFHLACDATHAEAVATLRRRKGRTAKPLAVMVGDVAAAERMAVVDEQERRLLTGASAPIILLRRHRMATQPVASEVAPDADLLGVMLPYTPLHHLLCVGMPPLVMTSGNLADEPIVHDNAVAVERLMPLCDAFLLHDREIHVPCDDAVMRSAAGLPVAIRRSRGQVPLPVRFGRQGADLVAAGGDLKAAIGVLRKDRLHLSQHLGDAVHPETLSAMTRAADHLVQLFAARPEAVAADLHPGYLSTGWARRFARERGIPLLLVQHHEAHAAALAADLGWPVDGPAARPLLVACFDGTGFGSDGSVWGGEFFLFEAGGLRRVASLVPLRLPGGDICIRQPWRTAVGLLHAAGGGSLEQHAGDPRLPPFVHAAGQEADIVRRQLAGASQCISSSSMGRLFDGVASLLGISHESRYEAEAAMKLESLAARATPTSGPGFVLQEIDGLLRADWRPVVRWIADAAGAAAPPAAVAARFHEAVAEMVVEVATRMGCSDAVGLSGGVFQNALLLTRTTELLRRAGFEPACHHAVPPNDGGLAVGQAFLASRRLEDRGNQASSDS